MPTINQGFTTYFWENDNEYSEDPIALTLMSTGSWLLEIPGEDNDEIMKLYITMSDMERFIWWLHSNVEKVKTNG